MDHIPYIKRCIHLAKSTSANVKTNPAVGALIRLEDKIIAEGAYKEFGGPHAEVVALQNLDDRFKARIKDCILYVTLEPCCIHGKTPPCTDAIIRSGIKNVVIGCIDPNAKINSKGVDLLKAEGIQVEVGICESECQDLINPFRINQLESRPYVILKYAVSKHNIFGREDESVWFSNDLSKRLAHKWRSEVDAILVGSNTAILDNPKLNSRYGYSKDPMRILLDREGKTPIGHHLLSDSLPTIAYSLSNQQSNDFKTNLPYPDSLKALLRSILDKDIGKLLVEGGARTIKSFIKEDYWDELRIIKTDHEMNEGLKAPNVEGKLIDRYRLGSDEIVIIQNPRKNLS